MFDGREMFDGEHIARCGRAWLLNEMTRGDPIRGGWSSDAVRDALDLCRASKSCRSECSVNVDMTAYKAAFMHHHHKGRRQPRAAYSMGLIWWWARLGSRARSLVDVNALAHTRPSRMPPSGSAASPPNAQIADFPDPDFRSWVRVRRRRIATCHAAGRKARGSHNQALGSYVGISGNTPAGHTFFCPRSRREPLKRRKTTLCRNFRERSGWPHVLLSTGSSRALQAPEDHMRKDRWNINILGSCHLLRNTVHRSPSKVPALRHHGLQPSDPVAERQR